MLPNEIKVGPITYTIQEVDELRGDSGQLLLGQIEYHKARIRLLDSLNANAKEVTLWHELLHALLAGAGYTDHNEQHIDAIAHGLVQLLRDNPGMLYA